MLDAVGGQIKKRINVIHIPVTVHHVGDNECHSRPSKLTRRSLAIGFRTTNHSGCRTDGDEPLGFEALNRRVAVSSVHRDTSVEPKRVTACHLLIVA